MDSEALLVRPVTYREREERRVECGSDDIYDGGHRDSLCEWADGVLVAVDVELVVVERAPVLPPLERRIDRLRVVQRLDGDET